jgi:hypothetical protein
MDEKTQKKVEAAVLEILRGSDMASLTEYKVRSAAADRLGIDLSLPDRKLFVRRLVEDYLQSLADEDEKKQQGGSGEEGDPKKEHRQEEEQKEEKGQEKVEEDEEEEEEEKKVVVGKELDDNGDLILCRVSSTFFLARLNKGKRSARFLRCDVFALAAVVQQEGDAVRFQGHDAGVHPRVLPEGRQGDALLQRYCKSCNLS